MAGRMMRDRGGRFGTRWWRGGLLLGLVCVSLGVLGGCASTPAPVATEYPFAEEFSLHGYDGIVVSVTAAEGQLLFEDGRARVAERIAAAVQGRIKHLQVLAPEEVGPRVLRMQVHMTRYDQGDRLKRATLAGLGKVNLVGTVTVRDGADDRLLGEYIVDKTFAWGGFYGGMTTVREVEVGFAEGVARGLSREH